MSKIEVREDRIGPTGIASEKKTEEKGKSKKKEVSSPKKTEKENFAARKEKLVSLMESQAEQPSERKGSPMRILKEQQQNARKILTKYI